MLELEHLTKRFEGANVLSDISLKIEKGEIVSILGPSGCGKTTLLNTILGLTEPTSGRILLDGRDITRVPMKDRGFNIVFQDYALFPNLNARENIVYGLRNRPDASTTQEVDELIDLLGLRPHLDKRIDELSGGQKQRVAIARPLVMKPKLLLMDEPLSALDGIIKESIKDRIKAIARQYQLTTIIVTHDPEEALTLSDRVLIIDRGLISQYDKPRSSVRDAAFLCYYVVLAALLLSVFAVMFVVPFVKSWPYQIEPTAETFIRVVSDPAIGRVYLNSIGVALASAALGTAVTYFAGMINARSKLSGWCRRAMDSLAMITNTVPGMVIGVGFLFAFAGTPLANTFLILVLANLVHFFTTPYLLSQSAFSKMNASWETTGALMGDSWLATMRRVVIPNSMTTIVQMFGYLFINALVTISAVVFLCGAQTMLLTTKIKELQYFEKFDEIFVLSLLIFFTNIAVKLILDEIAKRFGTHAS